MLGNTRRRLIKLLGGWTEDDVLREAFKEIWLPINPEDILQFKGDSFQFMGKPLRPDAVEQVKNEARQLSETKLWGIIKLDVRYHLSRKMFEEARVPEDIAWGMLATFLWDIVKTRVEQLSKLK